MAEEDTGGEWEASGLQIENDCTGYAGLLKKFGKVDAQTVEEWDDAMRMLFLENHVKMNNGWPYSRGIGHPLLAKAHIQQLPRIAAMVQNTKGNFRRGDRVVEGSWVVTQLAETAAGHVELNDEGNTFEQWETMMAERRRTELPTVTVSRCWDEFLSYEASGDELGALGALASGDGCSRDGDADGDGDLDGGGGGGRGGGGGIRLAFGKTKERWFYVSYNVAMTSDELCGVQPIGGGETKGGGVGGVGPTT